MKYMPYNQSDANDFYIPQYLSSIPQYTYNPTLQDDERALDHPLIKLLDFFQKILIYVCDKTADFITTLEMKIINKRKRQKK